MDALQKWFTTTPDGAKYIEGNEITAPLFEILCFMLVVLRIMDKNHSTFRQTQKYFEPFVARSAEIQTYIRKWETLSGAEKEGQYDEGKMRKAGLVTVQKNIVFGNKSVWVKGATLLKEHDNIKQLLDDTLQALNDYLDS